MGKRQRGRWAPVQVYRTLNEQQTECRYEGDSLPAARAACTEEGDHVVQAWLKQEYLWRAVSDEQVQQAAQPKEGDHVGR